MLVEEVMTPKKNLVIVSPMDSIREVLMLMKKNDIKSVIVEKTSASGAYAIITLKDILESIVAEDGDIDLLNVYDIASTPSISISRKIDIKYASIMMTKYNIDRLLVIDNNELYGIITLSDIMRVILN